MDWLIYVIFRFIYWKYLPIYAIMVLVVVMTAIIWYVYDSLKWKKASQMEVIK